MKIIWLGQSGLLLVSGKKKIIIDPYLSDSLKKTDRKMSRATRVNKHFFHIKPDIMILTNAEPDHTDIKTVSRYVSKSKHPITVLCSEKSYNRLISGDIQGRYNRVVFEEGSEWSLDNLHMEAVTAKSNDKTSFGLLITDLHTKKVYYYASDTLYSKYLFDDLPDQIDVAFIPVNGENGCMNMTDAERFSQNLPAKKIVPIHYGMFDSLDPKKISFQDRLVIPKIYKVIPIDTGDMDDELSNSKKKNVAHISLSSAIKQEKANEKERIFAEKVAREMRKQLESEAENADKNAKKSSGKKSKNKLFGRKKEDTEEEALISDILSNTLEISVISEDTIKSHEVIKEENQIDTINQVLAEESASAEIQHQDDVSKENITEQVKQEPKIDFDAETLDEFAVRKAGYIQNSNYEKVYDPFERNDDIKTQDAPEFTLSTSKPEEKPYDSARVSDEDKINAYIEEIEKFQRGDTANFKKIDISPDERNNY